MKPSPPDPGLPTISWQGGVDGTLHLLDQTRLPETEEVLVCADLESLIDAIITLAVRGAPAIGVAAAYGMVIGVRSLLSTDTTFAKAVSDVGTRLCAARPTAVNLAWAVQRMRTRADSEPELAALLDEARKIHLEDEQLCLNMGHVGADLIEDGMTVLTHCNAGRLATGGEGTALALLFAAHRAGRRFRVLADETRPLLQGARLTAFELQRAGIPVDVIVDSAAAGLMARGQVHLVVTGADRIAANGDVANKVGTYGLALAAAAHSVPFYVVAPASTFDLSLANGTLIPIEERSPNEVLQFHGIGIAPAGVSARNPAFDITPARLLTGLVTDRGLIRPVTEVGIKALLGERR